MGAVLLYHTTSNVVQILAAVLLGNGIGFHGHSPHISIRNRNSPTTSLRGILLSTIAMRCFARSANPVERFVRSAAGFHVHDWGASYLRVHEGRMGHEGPGVFIPASCSTSPGDVAALAFPRLLDTCQRPARIAWMARPRHPNKHIERAVQYAEALGWRLEISNGHAWGRLFCPLTTREGCIVSVWSTPHKPENHARHIRREVDLCPHGQHNTMSDAEEDVENGTQESG